MTTVQHLLMKKLLGILVLGLFLCSNSFLTEAADTNLVKGQTYEGEISWHRYNIQLPPGDWIYQYSEREWISDLDFHSIQFVQLQGKLVSRGVSFGEFNGRGRIIGELMSTKKECCCECDCVECTCVECDCCSDKGEI